MDSRTIILCGQIAALAAGVAMLVGAVWFDTPLGVAIGYFFVLMTAQGLIGPNGGALASAAVPDHLGTGSAVLGLSSGSPPAPSPTSPALAVTIPPYR